EVVGGSGGGRGGFFVRIEKHREIVFGDRARLRVAPFALGVIVQALAEEIGFAVGKPRDGPWPDAVDRQPLAAGLDNHFERRTTEPIEQQPAERLEALLAGAAEADQEPELALAMKVGAPGARRQLLLAT